METSLNFLQFVGQEQVQRAITISLVSPLVGSLLIVGKTGTGKSSLINSLNDILPNINKINIPSSIELDMLLGSIDVDKSLTEGAYLLKKGLLGQGNGHLLVMDNSQFCSSGTIKNIINVQKQGYYHLEREGFSDIISTYFNFIATYTIANDTECNIPINKFSMYVETKELTDISLRQKALKTLFDNDSYKEKLAFIKNNIIEARKNYSQIQVDEKLILLASKYCTELNCIGNDTEINIIRVAKAIAALEKRQFVLPKDIDEACLYVLPHQKNKQFTDLSASEDRLENNKTELEEDNNCNQTKNSIEEGKGNKEQQTQYNGAAFESSSSNIEEKDESYPKNKLEDSSEMASDNIAKEDVANIESHIIIPNIEIINSIKNNQCLLKTGRRKGMEIESNTGRYSFVRIPKGRVKKLAFLPTLKAAAPFQKIRPSNGLAINIKKQDYREKVITKPVNNAFVFLVDASGSMGAKKRMSTVKGTILEILKEAYIHREVVSLIVFRKNEAEVILPLTNSMELANRKLRDLSTGGKTPLHEGLATSYKMINNIKSHYNPVLILITDGKINGDKIGNLSPWEQAKYWGNKINAINIHSLVIDTNQDYIKLHLAEELATILGAQYYALSNLSKLKLIKLARSTF